MLFTYTAVKKDGTHYDGTLEAADRFALYKTLHDQGDTVLSAKEKGARGKLRKLFNISFGGVKAADRVMFAKNLSAMLKAGLPLSRALSILERQIGSREWKNIFTKLQDSLSKGTAFASALEAFPKAFPKILTSMVAAGEESGSLAESLLLVGDQLEKTYRLQKKIRGAMMYPAIILTVMLGIGVMMFVYVIPKLTETFKGFNAELPASTQFILNSSDFVQAHYIVIIAVVLILAAALYVFSRTDIGRRVIDRTILKLPVIGPIAIQANSARTARTLSSLISSGVEIVNAFGITSTVLQNVHYKTMLKDTAEKIQKGSTLESLFEPHTDLYPIFVAEMIGVGEETGTLAKSLLEVASFYENEVDEKTKDMSTIIEPVLMVVIGLGVGFFAIAMISPIYSLSNNIQ